MAFHPAELEVQHGDTIVWINQDVFPHTATARGTPGWSTGTLTQGQSARKVANESGRQSYLCELHPTMTGTVVVR
jgi:plastocyanin